MGRSIGLPAQQASGSFLHGASGAFFSVSGTSDGQVQRVRRDGLEAQFPIAYTIGSGNAAVGYLLSIENRLYQSPLTFYAATGRFGMAPGMENLTDPDFMRPVMAECLWCHAGKPNPVPHSLNRYYDPPLEASVISCERCHGPSDAHLAHPSRDTILDPAELAAPLRDSVCEQCHLSGAQRVLNPGRELNDFQPGMALEEVLTVYVAGHDRAKANPGEEFKVVSHFEQLVLSRCFRESGSVLWCGTCHDPHEDAGNPRAVQIGKCQSCHQELTPTGHGAPTGDCVSCHMARRQSRDSGHSAFTDHHIAARPTPVVKRQETAARQDLPLRAWREPAVHFRKRNLGIAYARAAETSGSRQHLEQGLRRLTEVARETSADPDVLSGLGMALLLEGSHQQGRERLEQAVAAEPANPLRYPPVAAAWWQVGNDLKAMETLRVAIQIDPFYLPAYRMLAQVLRGRGQQDKAREIWEAYLQRVPQSIPARLALQKLVRQSNP